MEKRSEDPVPLRLRITAKIVNGGLAGIVGVLAVFPIDLVKTRLQSQVVGPNGEVMYKSMFDCFKKVYKTEGFGGMYRGSGINMLMVSPEKAVKLCANDGFRFLLGDSSGDLPLEREMLAGGLAGACQVVITNPMELVKIRMQESGRLAVEAKKAGKSVKTVSSWRMAYDLYKERGFTGMYQGIKATAIRDVTFSIIYFPLFARLNKMGPKREDGSSVFWYSFLAGCIAGSTAALVVNPFDVVKTRLQLVKKELNERTYTSVTDCVNKMWKNEGLTAFFKGGACRMMVVAPLFGIAQTVYYFGIAEMFLGIR